MLSYLNKIMVWQSNFIFHIHYKRSMFCDRVTPMGILLRHLLTKQIHFETRMSRICCLVAKVKSTSVCLLRRLFFTLHNFTGNVFI